MDDHIPKSETNFVKMGLNRKTGGGDRSSPEYFTNLFLLIFALILFNM